MNVSASQALNARNGAVGFVDIHSGVFVANGFCACHSGVTFIMPDAARRPVTNPPIIAPYRFTPMIRFCISRHARCRCTPGRPRSCAIRDARIVTVSGPVIEKGTVVMRDGLIEAVGANVAIPPEAWIIEGEGLTVYPGLIDALSTVGMPEAAPRRRRRAAIRAAPPAPVPATLPRSARARGSSLEHKLAARGRQLNARRPPHRATAQRWASPPPWSFPTRGIFAGQGAVVNLAGEKGGTWWWPARRRMYLTLLRAAASRASPAR